jgi:hypothetical protein
MRIFGEWRRDKKLTPALIACIVIIVALLALVGYLLLSKSDSGSSGSKNDDKKESGRVVKEIGELYIVPTEEEPTVAAIKDKSKLSKQDFFKDAQNGDYLVVYSKAGLALIYRESVDKLVNAGPINANATQSTDQTSGQ